MEMHQLRYFASVAELNSFTRAAEACEVSQPSLSQQIANLEKELGQLLFERLGRGIRLTEAGRVLRDRVGQILRLVDDAKASVSEAADAGRLVVGAIPTVAPYFLPPLLTQFASDYPRGQVEVVEETTANIVRLLGAGDIDLALVAQPVQGEHLLVESLFLEELLVVLPAGHRLTDKRKLTLADLATEPFVLLNEAHCLTGNTLSFCTQHALAPIVTARIQQLTTVQELVRLKHGISLVPELAARADNSPGRVYRSLSGDKPTRTIAVAWNTMRYQTNIFRGFLKTLRDHVAKASAAGEGVGALD